MPHLRRFFPLLFGLILAAAAQAQVGPAITVIHVGKDSGGFDDFQYYGQFGGIAAYSMATTSCNPGTIPANWDDDDHPVIAQNMFRLADGRFEQLGQSWLKHGFCAVNQNGCGTCQNTDCDSLGLGCADTYSSSLNDGFDGGPKYLVNATTGTHIDPHPDPTGPSTIRGRLQVAVADIDPAQNPGARYFVESQYVSEHTASFGNGEIANSWRPLQVNSVAGIQGGGATVVGECAPYAWQAEDPQVVVTEIVNTHEGGGGLHGHYTLGHRVTDLGGGTFRYDYVLYNRTSERSAGSFAVPLGASVNVTNLFFNDVDYHSGEPFDGTDWVPTHGGNVFTWQTAQDHATDAYANALRWGTMYSFGFDADAPPVAGSVEIGMFAPGGGSDVLVAAAMVPDGGPAVGTGYCFGDGSGTPCPCSNDNDGSVPGSGCANGVHASGALLTGSGTASLSNDTLVLTTVNAEPGNSGLYFQANNDLSPGIVWGDGLQCAGGGLKRLQVRFADATGMSSTTIGISAKAGNITVGDTRFYQCWYRNPLNPPCGAGMNDFNASNGYAITWAP